jgi:hypothetical protein
LLINLAGDHNHYQLGDQEEGLRSKRKQMWIGAGAGARTGAVISKKKGEGAIIGGPAGAGVGAGTGANYRRKQKGIEQFHFIVMSVQPYRRILDTLL